MVESLIRPQHNTGATRPLPLFMLLPLFMCICPGENKPKDQKLAEQLIRYLDAVACGESKDKIERGNRDTTNSQQKQKYNK